MGLLDTFKSASGAKSPKASQAAAAPDAVAAARTRARRRLIGATVLLGIGVIGFPLLFETQPRPVPVDIPIQIPAKDKLPPLVLAPVTTASAETGGSPLSAASGPDVLTERASEQGRDMPLPGAEPVSAATPAPARAPDAPKPAASKPTVAKAADINSAEARSAAKPRDDDGARAKALLEGRAATAAAAAAAAAADASRLVVQVGAYTEADKLRDVRSRVEKLGLSTYTQVVEIKGTRHTRVRVGPFTTRAEADKAAARIKAAGLPVAVLTL